MSGPAVHPAAPHDAPPAKGSGAGWEVGRTIRLAAPLIGGQLALVGLSAIDTVMAGRFDAAALAAVAVGSSIFFALDLFVFGTLLAVPPVVAELDGAGRRSRVGPFLRQAFWVALVMGLLLVAALVHTEPFLHLFRVQPEIAPVTAEYLRALCWGVPAWVVYLTLRFTSEGLGETRPHLYAGLLGLPLNVAANYALMYGAFGLPALGAVGCGYATSVVWTVQAMAIVAWVAWRREYRGLHLLVRLDRPRPRRIGRILRLGLPIAVTLFVEGSIFTAVALVLASMGTEVVAGHQVALSFVAVTFMFPLGFAMAITVRVGNAMGRRDARGARRAAAVGVGLAMACQVISAGVMLLAPGWVAEIYSDDPAVIAVAVDLLFFAALFQLSDGLQVSAGGALRGLQDTRVPMLVVIVAYWLVGLPAGWYLTFRAGWGAGGMWLGLVAGLSVAALLLVLRFLRVSARLARRFEALPAAPVNRQSIT